MARAFGGLLLGLGALLGTVPAFATKPTPPATWAKFARIEQRFYELDAQNMNVISCQISVPQIAQELAAIRQRLGKTAVPQADTENYRLSFLKSSGLQIDDPQMVYKSGSAVPKAGDAEFKENEAKFQKAFDTEISQIDGVIRDVFSALTTPRQADYELQDITGNDDHYTLHYRDDGAEVVEVISGNKDVETSTRAGERVTAVSLFNKMPSGKWLFNFVYMRGISHDSEKYEKIQPAYQKIGGVIFPREIEAVAAVSTDGRKAAVMYQIQLVHCNAR